MCKSIPGTQKHMTMDQRIIIEKGLDQGSPPFVALLYS